MPVGSFPQYAPSQVANAPLPPMGELPKAEAFSSAASNCCKSCILAWSSADRFLLVDVLETLLQKPPITVWIPDAGVVCVARTSARVLPQRVMSPMPCTLATPGKLCPYPGPPNQAMLASCECVAQKPWVRVAPLPVFSNRQN